MQPESSPEVDDLAIAIASIHRAASRSPVKKSHYTPPSSRRTRYSPVTIYDLPSNSSRESSPTLVDEKRPLVEIATPRKAKRGGSSGQNESGPPQKRVRLALAPAQDSSEAERSRDFWYPDGNVVIKVENTYFKLFRSRLARYCEVFAAGFRSTSPPTTTQAGPSPSPTPTLNAVTTQPQPSQQPAAVSSSDVEAAPLDSTASQTDVLKAETGTMATQPDPSTTQTPEAQTCAAAGPSKVAPPSTTSEIMDGCPVYTLSDLSPHDFEIFLKYLEMPLENSLSAAPITTVLSLIRASSALECKSMLSMMLKRITARWSSPMPPQMRTKDQSENALEMIPLARKHAIPGALKRAFYELLRSDVFWASLSSSAANPDARRLSDTDLVRLQTARWELHKRWSALLVAPPKAHVGGLCAQCPAMAERDGGAARAWQVEVAVEFGARAGETGDARDVFGDIQDVLRWIESMRGRGKWCDHCLDERKKAWEDARTEWWKDLDKWLQIGESDIGVSVAPPGSRT